MFLLRLAIKNLLRNPRRALLSVVAIVAGIYVLLLGNGFVSGMKENIVRTQIDTVTGHLAVRPADYPTDILSYPIDELLEVPPDAVSWLDDNARAWTRRILFTPEVIAGSDGIRVRGVGYDPATDEAVFPRKNWAYDGEWPVIAEDGVALAPTLAKLLDVGVGDYITLKVRSHPGAINAMQVPVSAIFYSGAPFLDHATVFVPWPLTQQLLLHEDLVSHVHVRLGSRGSRVPALASTLQAAVPGSESITWETESADLVAAQNIRQTALNFITVILLLVSALSIANTVLMAAYERIREVGTLRAMGMTRTGVLQLFVYEGAIMGGLGGLLGTVLGGISVWYWSTEGIDLAPLIEEAGTETYANLPFSALIYMDFSPTMLVVAFVFGLVVAVGASVYPANVASNMVPADAVRG